MNKLQLMEDHYAKAVKLSEEIAFELAVKIMKKNPVIHSFLMGMGIWAFEDSNEVEVTDPEIICEFDDFMMNWDDYLKISGGYMYLYKDGKTIRSKENKEIKIQYA